MHTQSTALWEHEHSFGQEEAKAGERSTRLVIVITGVMMIVEIVAGIAFGSMALLADGMHMGSHAAALGISAAAYMYARKYARDCRFCFGTGKVNGLAGYTSAIILAVFALSMAWKSIGRLINPEEIVFDQAILVAAVGLLVNGISVWILNAKQPHSNDAHSHDAHSHPAHSHHSGEHSDHNLRSAYLHVLADTLTSVLAIIALVSGKYFGLLWMDALMGVLGAVLVGRWSIGLMRDTSQVLLDQQAPGMIRREITEAIESQDDNRISDLHLWAIGPNIFAAIISIVTDSPRQPDEYKQLIPAHLGLVHATIEVHQCKAS
jgi:cation diffusion facilitator family transporter